MLGFPAVVLAQTESPLIFIASCYVGFSSQHWSSEPGSLAWGWDPSSLIRKVPLQLRYPSGFSTALSFLHPSYQSQGGSFFISLVIKLLLGWSSDSYPGWLFSNLGYNFDVVKVSACNFYLLCHLDQVSPCTFMLCRHFFLKSHEPTSASFLFSFAASLRLSGFVELKIAKGLALD